MDLAPVMDWSVAGRRPGRCIVLFTLFLAAVSGFCPRAEADSPAGRDARLIHAAAHVLDLHGPSVERLEASAEQPVDPLADDDLASEQRLGPAVQGPEPAATFNGRPAFLARQVLTSSNPARGPPSP
jgi:hypothetical protein